MHRASPGRPNPYRVPRPAVISFSGGRTSAYMFKHIVDVHGVRLPDDIAVVFANGIVTLLNGRAANWHKNSSSRGSGGGLPQAHCLVAKLAQCFSGNQMALDVEGVVDGGVGREKPLRRSSRFETLHSSFPLSDWQVRILGSVVLPATKIMALGKAQILQSSTVRWQFVCDNGNRDKALLSQQFAHQFERRLLVSARPNQDIQHFAFAIDSAP